MQVITVNQQLSISGQLNEEDVRRLADAGVEIFICNRPDHEAAEQPTFSSLQAAAVVSGAQMHHLPFKSGAMQAADIASMATLLKAG